MQGHEDTSDILSGIGRALFGVAVVLSITGVGLIAYGINLLDETEAALVTAQHVSAVDEKKEVRPEDRIPLGLPLRYDATVTQSGDGKLPKTRYYARPETR